MKSAHNLLVILIITLNSSCALGMGQKRDTCESPVLPARPPKNLCIANGDGTCEKWNSVLQKNEHISDLNFVCKNVSDYNREQEYIDLLLDLLKQ